MKSSPASLALCALLCGAALPGPASGRPPAPAPGDPERVAAAAPAQWAELWPGEMWQAGPLKEGGGRLLVAYGGYRADEAGAKNWALSLARAGEFAFVVAVKGPAAVDYSDHGKLAANKALAGKLEGYAGVTIAAHSSGAYVAHELLLLPEFRQSAALLKKTEYYGLDGAACRPCAGLAGSGFRYACVAGKQGALRTANYWSNSECGAGHFTDLPLSAGCTGKWCLHGALVNSNAAAFGADAPPIAGYYNDPALSAPSAFLGTAR